MAERISDYEAIGLAASLPPEAPHILSVADEEIAPVPEREVVAEIDIDEYEDALRDPEWHAIMRHAIGSRDNLRKEGRSA